MKDPERTSYLNKAKKFLSTPAGIALTLLCAAVFITGIVYLITTTKILYVGWNILHAPSGGKRAKACGDRPPAP